ncbi:MAG: hypothetical protein AB1782_16325 [Cyanobacteriota bacterium]
MSIAIPQSHLYIFTEDQRNNNHYEEGFTENFMNDFQYITTLFDNDFMLKLKEPGFIDIIKAIGLFILAILFIILVLISLTIGFIIGLFIYAFKKVAHYIRRACNALLK